MALHSAWTSAAMMQQQRGVQQQNFGIVRQNSSPALVQAPVVYQKGAVTNLSRQSSMSTAPSVSQVPQQLATFPSARASSLSYVPSLGGSTGQSSQLRAPTPPVRSVAGGSMAAPPGSAVLMPRGTTALTSPLHSGSKAKAALSPTSTAFSYSPVQVQARLQQLADQTATTAGALQALSQATACAPSMGSSQDVFSPRSSRLILQQNDVEATSQAYRMNSSPVMLAPPPAMVDFAMLAPSPAMVVTAQEANAQQSQVQRIQNVIGSPTTPTIAPTRSSPVREFVPVALGEDPYLHSPTFMPTKAAAQLSSASPRSDEMFHSPENSPAKVSAAGLSTSTPRCNDYSKLDFKVEASFQSGGSVSSSTRSQGAATCALCHALLSYSIGHQNYQVLLAASNSAMSQDLIERLLSMTTTEADQTLTVTSLCKFHKSHMNRYDLWTRTHANVKINTAAAQDITLKSVANAATIGEDIEQLQEEVRQASPGYLEGISHYVKQLQNSLRANVAANWRAKARDWIQNQEAQIDEDEEHMNHRINERRSQMHDQLSRFEKEARNDFWQDQLKKRRKPQLECAEKGQNLQTWKRCGYLDELKQMAALEEVREAMQPRAESDFVSSKVAQRRSQKEKELDIWSAKVEHLLLLHEGQAEKNSARLLERVDRKLKKLEEEQKIDLRRVLTRYRQHIYRIQNLLEKTRRGQSLRVQHHSARATRGATEMLSFVHCVIRSELSVPIDYSTRSGVRPDSCRDIGSGSCTLELAAFAEFLGVRYPSLHAAFAAIDLTRSGRITGFELNTWMILHSCPGEASLVFKHLDRQAGGHVRLSSFGILSPSFLSAGLRVGRPAGSRSSTLLVKIWSLLARGTQESRSSRAAPDTFFVATQLTQRILFFAEDSLIYSARCDIADTSFALMSSRSTASSVTKLVEGALTAKSHEGEHIRTDIGRWAQAVAGDGLTGRHRYMVTSRGARPLSRSSTPVRTRPNSMDRFAAEASDDWSRSLRAQTTQRSSPSRGRRRSHRGAPPPKSNSFLDDTKILRSDSRCRSSSFERSASPKPATSSTSQKVSHSSLLCVQAVDNDTLSYVPRSVERQESPYAGSSIIRTVDPFTTQADTINRDGVVPSPTIGRPVVVRYVPHTISKDGHDVTIARIAPTSNGYHTPTASGPSSPALVTHSAQALTSGASSPVVGGRVQVPSNASSQLSVLTSTLAQRPPSQQAPSVGVPVRIHRL